MPTCPSLHTSTAIWDPFQVLVAMEALRTSLRDNWASVAWLRTVEPLQGGDEVEGKHPTQEHPIHTVPKEGLVSGDGLRRGVSNERAVAVRWFPSLHRSIDIDYTDI